MEHFKEFRDREKRRSKLRALEKLRLFVRIIRFAKRLECVRLAGGYGSGSIPLASSIFQTVAESPLKFLQQIKRPPTRQLYAQSHPAQGLARRAGQCPASAIGRNSYARAGYEP